MAVTLWSSAVLPGVRKELLAEDQDAFFEQAAGRDAAAAEARKALGELLAAHGVAAEELRPAPAVRAVVPAGALDAIARSPGVAWVGLDERPKIPTSAVFGASVQADAVHGWAYRGGGKVVGLSLLDTPNDARCLANAVIRPGTPATSNEARVAAGVLAADLDATCTPEARGGVVPRATVAVAHNGVVSGCGGECWAVQQGATSLGIGWTEVSSLLADQGLNERDAYLDSLVKSWPYPLVVASAGNRNALDGSPCSTDPTAGYVQNHLLSGLVVGGADDRGTAERGDDVLYACSSWRNPPSNDRELPHLVAPAVQVEAGGGTPADGTSLAAAVVAGIGAQLQEANPGIAIWPEAQRAILLATATGDLDGVEDVRSWTDQKDGFGTVLAGKAVLYAAPQHRVQGLPAESPRAHGFDYGTMSFGTDFPSGFYQRGGVDVRWKVRVAPHGSARVVLVWDSTGVPGPSFSDPLDADLDLYVYDASGALVDGAFSYSRSVESVLVQNPTGQEQDYEVAVYKWSQNSTSTYFGLAFGPYREIACGVAGMDPVELAEVVLPERVLCPGWSQGGCTATGADAGGIPYELGLPVPESLGLPALPGERLPVIVWDRPTDCRNPDPAARALPAEARALAYWGGYDPVAGRFGPVRWVGLTLVDDVPDFADRIVTACWRGDPNQLYCPPEWPPFPGYVVPEPALVCRGGGASSEDLLRDPGVASGPWCAEAGSLGYLVVQVPSWIASDGTAVEGQRLWVSEGMGSLIGRGWVIRPEPGGPSDLVEVLPLSSDRGTFFVDASTGATYSTAWDPQGAAYVEENGLATAVIRREARGCSSLDCPGPRNRVLTRLQVFRRSPQLRVQPTFLVTDHDGSRVPLQDPRYQDLGLDLGPGFERAAERPAVPGTVMQSAPVFAAQYDAGACIWDPPPAAGHPCTTAGPDPRRLPGVFYADRPVDPANQEAVGLVLALRGLASRYPKGFELLGTGALRLLLWPGGGLGQRGLDLSVEPNDAAARMRYLWNLGHNHGATMRFDPGSCSRSDPGYLLMLDTCTAVEDGLCSPVSNAPPQVWDACPQAYCSSFWPGASCATDLSTCLAAATSSLQHGRVTLGCSNSSPPSSNEPQEVTRKRFGPAGLASTAEVWLRMTYQTAAAQGTGQVGSPAAAAGVVARLAESPRVGLLSADLVTGSQVLGPLYTEPLQQPEVVDVMLRQRFDLKMALLDPCLFDPEGCWPQALADLMDPARRAETFDLNGYGEWNYLQNHSMLGGGNHGWGLYRMWAGPHHDAVRVPWLMYWRFPHDPGATASADVAALAADPEAVDRKLRDLHVALAMTRHLYDVRYQHWMPHRLLGSCTERGDWKCVAYAHGASVNQLEVHCPSFGEDSGCAPSNPRKPLFLGAVNDYKEFLPWTHRAVRPRLVDYNQHIEPLLIAYFTSLDRRARDVVYEVERGMRLWADIHTDWIRPGSGRDLPAVAETLTDLYMYTWDRGGTRADADGVTTPSAPGYHDAGRVPRYILDDFGLPPTSTLADALDHLLEASQGNAVCLLAPCSSGAGGSCTPASDCSLAGIANGQWAIGFQTGFRLESGVAWTILWMHKLIRLFELGALDGPELATLKQRVGELWSNLVDLSGAWFVEKPDPGSDPYGLGPLVHPDWGLPAWAVPQAGAAEAFVSHRVASFVPACWPWATPPPGPAGLDAGRCTRALREMAWRIFSGQPSLVGLLGGLGPVSGLPGRIRELVLAGALLGSNGADFTIDSFEVNHFLRAMGVLQQIEGGVPGAGAPKLDRYPVDLSDGRDLGRAMVRVLERHPGGGWTSRVKLLVENEGCGARRLAVNLRLRLAKPAEDLQEDMADPSFCAQHPQVCAYAQANPREVLPPPLKIDIVARVAGPCAGGPSASGTRWTLDGLATGGQSCVPPPPWVKSFETMTPPCSTETNATYCAQDPGVCPLMQDGRVTAMDTPLDLYNDAHVPGDPGTPGEDRRLPSDRFVLDLSGYRYWLVTIEAEGGMEIDPRTSFDPDVHVLLRLFDEAGDSAKKKQTSLLTLPSGGLLCFPAKTSAQAAATLLPFATQHGDVNQSVTLWRYDAGPPAGLLLEDAGGVGSVLRPSYYGSLSYQEQLPSGGALPRLSYAGTVYPLLQLPAPPSGSGPDRLLGSIRCLSAGYAARSTMLVENVRKLYIGDPPLRPWGSDIGPHAVPDVFYRDQDPTQDTDPPAAAEVPYHNRVSDCDHPGLGCADCTDTPFSCSNGDCGFPGSTALDRYLRRLAESASTPEPGAPPPCRKQVGDQGMYAASNLCYASLDPRDLVRFLQAHPDLDSSTNPLACMPFTWTEYGQAKTCYEPVGPCHRAFGSTSNCRPDSGVRCGLSQ